MSKSALASLTAQYTDSENDDPQESPDSENSQVIIPPPRHTPHQTPEKTHSRNEATMVMKKNKKKRLKKVVKRLVSYQDDTIVSDEGDIEEEEEEFDEVENRRMSPCSDDHDEVCRPEIKLKQPLTQNDSTIEIEEESIEQSQNDNANSKIDKYGKYAHYGFTLPLEPKGKPLPELAEKIKQLYEKMETSNMEMNRVIQQRKEFRNPSIYEKLIQFCDINEFGTNYPPEIYDPLQWGAESFYEELARVQKNEMVKRQKEKKDTDKIEQVSALARKVEEEAKKRKSKWDQPASSAKPVVAPTLTTTVTGTKGTVISAFGSLPKKPSA